MTRKCIVIITDNVELSRAINNYLQHCFDRGLDIYFMTYNESKLSPMLMTEADIIILGLFRCYGLRVRAEGVMVAKSLVHHQKAFLVISGLVRADKLAAHSYWDMGSSDTLSERISRLLSKPVDWHAEVQQLEQYFSSYCFAPNVGHHAH